MNISLHVVYEGDIGRPTETGQFFLISQLLHGFLELQI